jgi:hypothetical protein
MAYAQPSHRIHTVIRFAGPPQAPYYATNARLKREAKNIKNHASATIVTCISDLGPSFGAHCSVA